MFSILMVIAFVMVLIKLIFNFDKNPKKNILIALFYHVTVLYCFVFGKLDVVYSTGTTESLSNVLLGFLKERITLSFLGGWMTLTIGLVVYYKYRKLLKRKKESANLISKETTN